MQKYMKVILASLHSVSPELFWSIWANAKISEKDAVNNLFGSKDITNDTQLLADIKKSRSRSVTPARTVSQRGTPHHSPRPSSATSRSSTRLSMGTPPNHPSSPDPYHIEELIVDDQSFIDGRENSDLLAFTSPRSSTTRVRVKLRRTSGPQNSGLRVETNGSSKRHGEVIYAKLVERVPPNKQRSNSIFSDTSEDNNLSESNNGGLAKLAAAYEDSDTDWMTDADVLRSPDGSEAPRTVSSESGELEYAGTARFDGQQTPTRTTLDKLGSELVDNIVRAPNDIMNGERSQWQDENSVSMTAVAAEGPTMMNGTPPLKPSVTFKSIVSSMVKTESPTSAEPRTPLVERVGREVVQNMDALKEVDEMLTRIEQVQRATQRATQEKLVESLSRINAPKGMTPSGRPLSGSGIPMIAMGSLPLSTSGTSIPSVSRGSSPSPRFGHSALSPSPTGGPKMVRVSSLPGPSFKTAPSTSSPVLNGTSSSSNHQVKHIPETATISSLPPKPTTSANSLRPRPLSGSFMSSVPANPSNLKSTITIDPPAPVITSQTKRELISPTKSSLATVFNSQTDIAKEFDDAIASGLDAIWEFSRRRKEHQPLIEKPEEVSRVIFETLQRKGPLSAVTMKNGLTLLRELLGYNLDGVLQNTNEILISILRCESRPEITADDQLEIDYEIDTVLKAFEKSIPYLDVLNAVAFVLKHPEPVEPRICFELLAKTVAKMHSHGDIFNETNEENGWDWDLVLGHIAEVGKVIGLIFVKHIDILISNQGLDSKNAATRKSAFDCAVGVCEKNGSVIAKRLYEEVGKRSGKSRETVIRGMMERRLK
jgi:hypothetical protein